MSTNTPNEDAITELRAVVARLRAPDGCPWDREQTHASLRSGLIEESHEVVEAIDKGDDANLREELGDLLLQVVMHSQIAAEEKRFDFNDVARGIAEKLVRRHPHVFGDVKAEDSATVLKQWDEIKRAEKGTAKGASILDGISSALPGLMRAQKTGVKVARVNFDWDDIDGSLVKIKEEIAEVEQEIADGNATQLEEELGDLLFATVNLVRKCKVDAELAMHKATAKFTRRFQAMEAILAERGEKLGDLQLPYLDTIWEEVKRREREKF